MIGFKALFIVVVILALMSSAVAVANARGFRPSDVNVAETAATIGLSVAGTVAIKKRGTIIYKLKQHRKTLELRQDFVKILGIKSITPYGNYVIVEDLSGRKIGHAYFKITNVPYLVDELDQQRKIFIVGNFVRTLSTLTFPFELIPRILPVSREIYMRQINKQINDLKLTLSAEAGVADPARQARLKNLEKIASRLLEGEGVRDVSFLVHIISYGKDEGEIARELQANTKTLMSTLEMGLNVKAERLYGFSMLRGITEFFRASVVQVPSKSCRILCWELAYLIPLARPKLPPMERLLGGVYIGRTTSGAVVCLDIEKYANPHIVVLGQTGTGKSVTAKSFASRFYDLYGTSILCIDFAGEYVDWVRSRGGKVIDMSRNVINPFELGPATLIDRVRQLVDAFEKICGFQTVHQRNAFTRYLSTAYYQKGYRVDDPASWSNPAPELAEIIQLIEDDIPNLHFMRQLTSQSLLDLLKGVASGPFGIFGKTTVTIDELTQGFTCIDLSKITSSYLSSIIVWTVLQYVDSKMRLNGVVKGVKLLIILDEAWKTAKSEDSLPVRIIKEGRKHGFAILAASQDQGVDLAESILSNAGTVIIHRTIHPKYLNFCKHAYGLSEQEVSRIPNLGVGEALVKLGDDPRPFFVQIDMEQVESSPNQISYEKPVPKQADSNKLGNVWANSKTDLSTDERNMFEFISTELLPTRDLYSRLGLDEYRGTKTKDSLVQKGLVRTIRLPKLRRVGRSPEGIVPANLDIKGRNGGIIHRYSVNLLEAEFTKLGFAVEKEKQKDDGIYDLILNGRSAIEVETGASDIESNLKKLQASSFKRRIMVCLDAGLRSRVAKLDCNGVTVCEFSEVIDAVKGSG